MRRRARDIVREQAGVAMPLALLLFLVCAMLASIVLAAATTSAGTAGALKESEQSYYAVTSAAKLFRDQLDGQTVVITQTKATGATGASVAPADADAAGETGAGYTLAVDGNNVLASPTLLQLAAVDVLTGSAQSVAGGTLALAGLAEGAWMRGRFGESALSSAIDSTLTLSPNIAGTANTDAADIDAALNVNVAQRILPDGTIELTFSQTAADDESYRLRLTLAADVDADEEIAEISSGSQIETRETRVTWWADELSVPEDAGQAGAGEVAP